MPIYQSPGFYLEEVIPAPARAGAEETAVPAFLGYTEKALDQKGLPLDFVPVLIRSMVDYMERFGGPAPYSLSEIHTDVRGNVLDTDLNHQYFTYDAVRMFFANGGRECYLVSTGPYSVGVQAVHFEKALEAAGKTAEITLLVAQDALLLPEPALYSVYRLMLSQCAERQDRFCIFDLREDDSWTDGIAAFKDQTGLENLKYGAAYTPFIRVNLPQEISYADIRGKIQQNNLPVDLATITPDPEITQLIEELEYATDDLALMQDKLADLLLSPPARLRPLTQTGNFSSLDQYYSLLKKEFLDYATANPGSQSSVRKYFLRLLGLPFALSTLLIDEWAVGLTGKVRKKVEKAINDVLATGPDSGALYPLVVLDNTGELSPLSPFGSPITRFPLRLEGIHPNPAFQFAWNYADHWNKLFLNTDTDTALLLHPSGSLNSTKKVKNMVHVEPLIHQAFTVLRDTIEGLLQSASEIPVALQSNLEESFPFFGQMMASLRDKLNTLPPSGAVAGAYAFTDRTSGIWKAPANLALQSVIGLSRNIDNEENGALNVDPQSGKSINAIRAFRGRGIMIWGARTLAGQDNEWRYLSVRRLISLIQKDVRSIVGEMVFERNDAITWYRIHGQVEDYLRRMWKRGALNGDRPNDAFYVRLGKDITMTEEDIQAGRLIVEIGVAAVRPAEFIILKYEQLI
jgi:hypothetical protein